MEPIDQKAALRRQAFDARKIAHKSNLDEVANTHLIAAVKGRGAATCVAGYMPIRTEISPILAMTHLHETGTEIAVPVIVAQDTALKWARWTPDDDMVEGAFKALVPADPIYIIPDLVVCPLVAFDAQGGRLGYGGGFYDRSLEELRAVRPTAALGFAYSAQELPQIPQEKTDQPLDAIVTERGVSDFLR